MWDSQFWRDAFERTLKTFAMALAATLTAAGFDLLDADWKAALAAAGMAALLSFLASVGQTGLTGRTPSQAVVAPIIAAEKTSEGKIVAGPAATTITDGTVVTVEPAPPPDRFGHPMT